MTLSDLNELKNGTTSLNRFQKHGPPKKSVSIRRRGDIVNTDHIIYSDEEDEEEDDDDDDDDLIVAGPRKGRRGLPGRARRPGRPPRRSTTSEEDEKPVRRSNRQNTSFLREPARSLKSHLPVAL